MKSLENYSVFTIINESRDYYLKSCKADAIERNEYRFGVVNEPMKLQLL